MKKHFKGWLILNWKTGEMRVVKRKPQKSKLGWAHIPVELDISVELPEEPQLKAKAEITLNRAKAEEIVISQW